MYEGYWGLGGRVFRNELHARSFYRSANHEEALSRLYYLVEERHGCGLLVGPAGTGKSLLMHLFAEELRVSGSCAIELGLLGTSADEFAWSLAESLGGGPPRGASPHELWQSIADRIAANRYQQISTVLLLDDVTAATRDVQLQIARLWQIDSAAEAQISIVLSGCADRLGQLAPELADLIDLRVDLEPFNAAELAAYVEATLRRAGRTEPIFDEAALDRLLAQTGGVPRRVNQLANLALAAGAGEARTRISDDMVDAVARELLIAPPAAALGL